MGRKRVVFIQSLEINMLSFRYTIQSMPNSDDKIRIKINIMNMHQTFHVIFFSLGVFRQSRAAPRCNRTRV